MHRTFDPRLTPLTSDISYDASVRYMYCYFSRRSDSTVIAAAKVQK